MKDHQIRELVNELRDIAIEYHGTQQLRERIARTVRAAMLHGAELVTTTYKLPAIGWLRADYQDDNRGLRGDAPLFVLGKKDPSTVWGLDYIPLSSNSPVITDGWVACGERMPEQFVEVLVCTEDGSRYVAALNQSMNWDDGDLFDDIQYVTHWMPMPAAPQEAKNV